MTIYIIKKRLNFIQRLNLINSHTEKDFKMPVLYDSTINYNRKKIAINIIQKLLDFQSN